MNFDEFTGEVQHRADEGTRGEAVRTTRAVLTTLGERLQSEEADDLAGPLPMEVDRYLEAAEGGQRFGYDEFVSRVAERAEVDEPDAAYRAKAVVALVADAVPPGELDDVRVELPEEYDDLFAFVDADETPW